MPVHINGYFSLPHPVSNFSWTIRCESGDRNVQWGMEWQRSNHGKNTVCVCLDVCVSPKPCEWHGPSEGAGHDWGGHCVKAATSGGHQEHAAMLGSWSSAGSRLTGISAWLWGSRRTCPHSWAPSSSAWRGRRLRNTFSICPYQAGPSFPPQDKGL